jgi:hypothetical protein
MLAHILAGALLGQIANGLPALVTVSLGDEIIIC